MAELFDVALFVAMAFAIAAGIALALAFALAPIALIVVLGLRSLGKGAWEETAAATGLELTGGLFGNRGLSGRRRGFDVKVFKLSKGRNRTQTIALVDGVHPGFSLAPERGLASLVVRDIETGDPDFDDRVLILGDPHLALSVLGQEVRDVAAVVVGEAGGAVKDGGIRLPLNGLEEAPSRLDAMLVLAELLKRPSDRELPGLLARQVLEDASPGVKLRAFR
ncbi:MAG: hypothetical protein AAFX50_04995, partial [Acidobacteriota bacterium]